MTKIMISAGEVSGDRHGAALATALRKQMSDVQLIGMGGEHMAEAGVDIYLNLTQYSTIGFIEPIRHLRRFFNALEQCDTVLKTQRPDLLVVIDFQGFHMALLKKAKTLGIPVLYYIAPQEWQWGSPKGGRKVVGVTSHILSIFKPEYDFYKALGGNATFVGHPLQDIVKTTMSKTEFRRHLDLPPRKRILAIFPGSRTQEIRHLLPIFLESARILESETGCMTVVSVAVPHLREEIDAQVAASDLNHCVLSDNSPHDVIANATVSLVASGTISLEHAILKQPCVVAYKLGRLSYWVAQALVGRKFRALKYISLPNLLLGKGVYPELVQNQVTVRNCVAEARPFFESDVHLAHFREELSGLTDAMGQPGAVERAAAYIASLFRS